LEVSIDNEKNIPVAVVNAAVGLLLPYMSGLTNNKLLNLLFEGVQNGPPDQYSTPADIENRLKISSSSVARLLASGALQSVRIGRSVRISESAITEMLQKSSTGYTALPEGEA
jgi:excisionase family DNA binding protein